MAFVLRCSPLNRALCNCPKFELLGPLESKKCSFYIGFSGRKNLKVFVFALVNSAFEFSIVGTDRNEPRATQ